MQSWAPNLDDRQPRGSGQAFSARTVTDMMSEQRNWPAICLMGPTAAGKTELALHLAEALPADIISVDSALVYRGMDIGTAKPDAETRRRFPHRLIDIRDPEQNYSAGDFVRDATEEIGRTRAAGRVPLLVGGTMLYFRALTQGIAALPQADPGLRAALEAEAAQSGWPAMHRKLAEVDSAAAERIGINDRQRIQRALEVYRLSGRPISEWHSAGPSGSDHRFIDASGAPFCFVKVALVPEPRAALHRRIEERFGRMLEQGFVEEVRRLHARPGLERSSPSMRAVGYRQLWSYLDGDCGLDEAVDRALAASRQLA
ncbi:MAG: tRNA (adenosine(37)-N6)-dimethylallyltransferase MiaA [Woeseiaceae bacterium]